MNMAMKPSFLSLKLWLLSRDYSQISMFLLLTVLYVISDDTEMESDAQNEAVDDKGSRTSGHAPTRSGRNRWSAWSCRSPGWDHAKTKLCGHALRSQKKRLRKGQTSVQVEICLEAKRKGSALQLPQVFLLSST